MKLLSDVNVNGFTIVVMGGGQVPELGAGLFLKQT